MAEPDSQPADEPLAKARLVRLLRDRPRLIDRGVRKDFLDQLKDNIEDRRKPSNVAEKSAREVLNRSAESAQPVLRDRVKDKMESANEGLLSSL